MIERFKVASRKFAKPKLLKDIYLSDDDKARLRETFGDLRVNAMLRSRFAAPEESIDRLQDARDLVIEEGDLLSFQAILGLASDPVADSSDRLEAISDGSAVIQSLTTAMLPSRHPGSPLLSPPRRRHYPPPATKLRLAP